MEHVLYGSAFEPAGNVQEEEDTDTQIVAVSVCVGGERIEAKRIEREVERS